MIAIADAKVAPTVTALQVQVVPIMVSPHKTSSPHCSTASPAPIDLAKSAKPPLDVVHLKPSAQPVFGVFELHVLPFAIFT
jgi:hypothetical protein